MSTCRYASLPHGNIFAARMEHGVQMPLTLGPVFSRREARNLIERCVEQGIIMPNRGKVAHNQLLHTKLPEDCEWDEAFESESGQFQIPEEFAKYFSRRYLMHLPGSDEMLALAS